MFQNKSRNKSNFKTTIIISGHGKKKYDTTGTGKHQEKCAVTKFRNTLMLNTGGVGWGSG